MAAPDAYTIATLGDSITDGWATTVDANLAWPTLLAKRLAADKRTQHVGVVNQGISGNQLLRNGAGVSMLARFDRDILARPGVRWVVLLGGINDINFRSRAGTTPLTPEELIAGYEQIIARCRAHGIRIIGATHHPAGGADDRDGAGEAIRQAVNTWIRTSGHFDAVVDFDAAIRDPGAARADEGGVRSRRPHSSERPRQRSDGRRVRPRAVRPLTGRSREEPCRCAGLARCRSLCSHSRLSAAARPPATAGAGTAGAPAHADAGDGARFA